MSGHIKYSTGCDRDCYCSRKKVPSDCGRDIDRAKCEPLSPCPKKILLECGTTGGMMMFSATGQTFTAANLSVDTLCFNKPEVKIQFSSQVTASVNPVAGTDTNTSNITQQDTEIVLFYELVSRSNSSEVTIGSWIFRRALTGGSITAATVDIDDLTAQTLATSDTFSFSKCINTCPGRFDYFVRVTATTVSQDTVTGTNNASATVSMGQLVAKIQES